MCDTAVVVRDDAVLFAKSSDRDPNEAQLLDWQPARERPRGALVRCTWITIPEVPRTHAVLLSRPYWMWGAEIGANEHGVTIGNEAVFTGDPVPRTGLTGMDLLRLALERADSAERAVEAIIDLAERHGQGGSCGHESHGFTYFSSFLVADRRGAFVLETAGRAWEAERVTGARSISNGLTIPGFAERHRDRVRTWASRCRVRRARTERGAASASGPLGMMALLRDHGDHDPDGRLGPRYDALTGGMRAPCMHAGGLVASSQSVASWVAELSPEGDRHWVTGTAAPCTSLFKPVRVGEPLDLGPAPTDVADPASLFWRHEALHRRILRAPEALLPPIAKERDAIERRWAASPPEPIQAFAEADEVLARWTARAEASAARPSWPRQVARYWEARDRWAGALGATGARRSFRSAWDAVGARR